MAASNQTVPSRRYLFGDFVLDTGARSLVSGNGPISLTLKEFDTLVILVESAGQAVEREVLISRVWPDSFVGDGSLAKNISILRKYIGAEAIQTVPKHGYRFAAQVSLVATPVSIPEVHITEPEDSGMHLITPREDPRPLRTWLIGAGLVCLVVLIAITARLQRWQSHAAELANRAPARIAVLPFRNISEVADGDYFSDGIAGELVTTLGQINGEKLRVLANDSSGEYKATNKSLVQISRELNAQYLVQGTVARQNKQVDVNVHLVRAADQSVMWAAKYSRPITELPHIQAEITESIAREVEVRLVPDTSVSRQNGRTLDPQAYDAYLHGRMELEHKNPAAAQRALEEFRQATVLDPKYAPAYAGISETYINLANNTPTQPAYAYAKESALAAIRLDDHLAEGHRDLAWILDNNESNWAGAQMEYQRAIELNPSDARAHHWYAQFLVEQQRPQDALREAKVGLDLDPISLSSNYNYAFMLIEAEQYDAAIAQLQHLLLREQNEVVYGYLGIAYDRKHEEEKSAEAFQRAADMSGLHKQYEANVARSLALAGKTAAASRILRKLQQEMDEGIWMPAINLSLAYFALGDQDRGFALLQRALEEHSCTVLEINTEPMLVAVKSDPRMVNLRTRFHLGVSSKVVPSSTP